MTDDRGHLRSLAGGGGAGRSLDIAAELCPLLGGIDGFISIARFARLSEPGKLLSLSFWRDEHAVAARRRRDDHRAAQVRGRGGVFRDERLRVAGVLRRDGMDARDQAPADSRAAHGWPSARDRKPGSPTCPDR